MIEHSFKLPNWIYLLIFSDSIIHFSSAIKKFQDEVRFKDLTNWNFRNLPRTTFRKSKKNRPGDLHVFTPRFWFGWVTGEIFVLATPEFLGWSRRRLKKPSRWKFLWIQIKESWLVGLIPAVNYYIRVCIN